MRLILICLVFACIQASGQIVLRINDAPTVSLDVKDLTKLPRHTAALNEHGKQVSYEGPLLHDVLVLGGIDFGKGLRGKQLSAYVTAVANDGYEVVYALAEFDPTVMDSDIIVADKRDGQPLGANEAPFRIVVPHDKRPTRSVKLLREIDIVHLKK
ncbi:MAG: molybdopterin-dependent oxidoreductase [Acidobacteriaceae bacterium]|nr:molybdopterin-dependent oxidoreductase [Acidobacteriaceae bacterium]MBV9499347.1 molybdopterin-dependent oxidoreductase [Acidobacteriaceae bacterium]